MSKNKKIVLEETPRGKIDRLKFGDKISKLMIEKGFTNDSFVNASGISLSMIQQIRCGRRLPGLDNYLLLIETLGVSDLLPLSDFVAIENEEIVKRDLVIHQLFELVKDMSPEQLEQFIIAVKALKNVFIKNN